MPNGQFKQLTKGADWRIYFHGTRIRATTTTWYGIWSGKIQKRCEHRIYAIHEQVTDLQISHPASIRVIYC